MYHPRDPDMATEPGPFRPHPIRQMRVPNGHFYAQIPVRALLLRRYARVTKEAPSPRIERGQPLGGWH